MFYFVELHLTYFIFTPVRELTQFKTTQLPHHFLASLNFNATSYKQSLYSSRNVNKVVIYTKKHLVFSPQWDPFSSSSSYHYEQGGTLFISVILSANLTIALWLWQLTHLPSCQLLQGPGFADSIARCGHFCGVGWHI